MSVAWYRGDGKLTGVRMAGVSSSSQEWVRRGVGGDSMAHRAAAAARESDAGGIQGSAGAVGGGWAVRGQAVLAQVVGGAAVPGVAPIPLAGAPVVLVFLAARTGGAVQVALAVFRAQRLLPTGAHAVVVTQAVPSSHLVTSVVPLLPVLHTYCAPPVTMQPL